MSDEPVSGILSLCGWNNSGIICEPKFSLSFYHAHRHAEVVPRSKAVSICFEVLLQ